jgi:transcriptional regulator with GAF, ATPase, and Fis domain
LVGEPSVTLGFSYLARKNIMNDGDLTGSGAKFRTVLHEINMVAPVDSAVLNGGETGTGKG